MRLVRHPERGRAPALSNLAVIVACVILVSACTGGGERKPEPTNPVRVEIIQEDGEVTASHDIVEAERGQTIELAVNSDAADEFHVHSDPKVELAVRAADRQTFTFSIETAGQYEMESHELEVTILKLQIS